MLIYINALKDPEGQEHQRMVDAAIALYEARIYDLPPPLQEYFDCDSSLEIVNDHNKGCSVNLISNDALELIENLDQLLTSYRIDLSKLPDGVTHVQFTTSHDKNTLLIGNKNKKIDSISVCGEK